MARRRVRLANVGVAGVVHQDPARVLAVGAVDNLDLLEAVTSRCFLDDLGMAFLELTAAQLVY